MKLTHYSDYALRSLIYLAVKPEPQALANISDIANSYQISKSHLTKIIHQLGQLGYIETIRGKNGGIRLARLPKEINLGVLIKQIEPDFALVECFVATVPTLNNGEQKGLPITLIGDSSLDLPPHNKSGAEPNADLSTDLSTDLSIEIKTESSSKKGCVISPACQLKGVFFEALTAFVTVLERYTLADLVSNKVELTDILS